MYLIGQNIKKARENKRMTISELAEKAGVAKSYLSSIERDIQSNPSIQFINKISGVLGVSMYELIYGYSEDIVNPLDKEWLEIFREAMDSRISKQILREYLAFNKWRTEKEE